MSLHLSLFYVKKIFGRWAKRAILSAAPVILGIAFITGQFLSIDLNASESFGRFLESNPVIDLAGFAAVSTPDMTQELASHPQVSEVHRVLYLGNSFVLQKTGGIAGAESRQVELVVVDVSFVSALTRLGIMGFPVLNGSKVLLPAQLANSLNVGVGDSLCLTNTSHSGPCESSPYFDVSGLLFPLAGDALWVYNPQVFGLGYLPLSGLLLPDVAFAHVSDLEVIQGLLEEGSEFPAVTYYIWLDRSGTVGVFDPRETEERYRAVALDLEQALTPYGGRVGLPESFPNILTRQREFHDQLLATRFVYLTFSLPVVVLAGYASFRGMKIFSYQRRKQLALMRTRGASEAQVGTLFTIEVLVIGVVTGALGYAGGLLYVSLLGGLPAGLDSMQFRFDPWSFLAAVNIGIGTIAVVLFSIARKVRYSSLTSEVRFAYFYEKSSQPVYRDVVVLTVGLSIMLYLFTRGAVQLSSNVVTFLLGGFEAILSILALASPVMIILASARLFTTKTWKLYGIGGRLVELVGRTKGILARKFTEVDLQRLSGVSLVLALVFALISFSLVAAASELQHARNNIILEVGSDVAVEAFEPPANATGDILGIPGVAGAVRVEWLALQDITFAVTSFVDYCRTAYWENLPLVVSAEKQPCSDDSASGVFISRETSSEYNLNPGDTLTVRLQGLESASLSVLGIVAGFPGMEQQVGLPRGHKMVYVDRDYLLSNIPESSLELFTQRSTFFRFLVKLHPDTDVEAVSRSIIERMPGAVRDIEILSVRLSGVAQDPYYGSILAFLRVEVITSILLGFLASALIMYLSGLERIRDVSIAKSRGATDGLIAMFFLSQGLILSLVGILVGVSAGLVSVLAYLHLVGFDETLLLQKPFVLDPLLGVFLVGLVLLVLVSALLVSYRLTRSDISAALRVG